MGPQLRRTDGLSLGYYGFDTSRPPFADVRVRQAFARAVDWRRLIALSAAGTQHAGDRHGPARDPRPERHRLPPGARSGRRHERCWPRRATAGGRASRRVILLGGRPEDRAFTAEIQSELGITIQVQFQADGYFDRLRDDPPQIFSMGWVADYPGPNDFLGILLGTGASNNYGRWSSAPFDGAIAEALSATDQTVARAAYDRAEGIVRDEAPTIPLTYDVGWSAGPDRPPRRLLERAGDHPDGRARVGAMTRAASPVRRTPVAAAVVHRLAPRCFAPSALRRRTRRPSAPRRRRRSSGHGVDFVQPATIEGTVQRVEILLSTPGAIGPDVLAVPDAADERQPHAPLPPRSVGRNHAAQHAVHRPLAPDRGRRDGRRRAAGDADATPTTASTGRRSTAPSSASTGRRATSRSASGR